MSDKAIFTTLTDANFQKEVLESTKPVLVQICTDWSGVSNIMSLIIEELLVDTKNQIKIGKLNIDLHKEVIKEYGIYEFPSILIFKNGQVVDYIFGAVPREMIKEKLKAVLLNRT